jgi:translation elongation factor P
MAKINGNNIKPGMVLEHNKGLWVVTKASHVKPGKGGAFANVEAKNLETGNKLNERFRSEDKVERVTLEQKEFSYLYEQGDALVFMDDATYEQTELQKDWVGEDRVAYLQDGMKVVIEMHEDRPIGLSLPDQDAGSRRDRADREGPDRLFLLQAGHRQQRRPHHDPALYGRGRADRRRHHDGRIRPARRIEVLVSRA